MILFPSGSSRPLSLPAASYVLVIRCAFASTTAVRRPMSSNTYVVRLPSGSGTFARSRGLRMSMRSPATPFRPTSVSTTRSREDLVV